jgi:toxin-antitoxin system PIN domain toxin
VKIPDVNLLLYAADRQSPQHEAANRWLTEAFAAPAGVGFAWLALVGFIRLSTRTGVFPQALAVEQAMAAVHHWLACPGAQVVHAGPRHAALLGRLLLGAGTAGNLTNDAHLAAIALEHGAVVGTFDRDFLRFAGLGVDFLGAHPRH